MTHVHHSAICSADLDSALRFWRDGLGLVELFDHEFTGDWPTLFGATSDQLRSIFLGDPTHPDSGIVELVGFADVESGSPVAPRPMTGFFLLSFNVDDIDATLARLASLGYADDVRRIEVAAGGDQRVPMAVVTAPDDVRVELIGPAR